MIQVRGYSEMTSPQNTKFQSPIPPMSPLVTFFIIPLPPCHQANGGKLFP